jgi:hypothetical protein
MLLTKRSPLGPKANPCGSVKPPLLVGTKAVTNAPVLDRKTVVK